MNSRALALGVWIVFGLLAASGIAAKYEQGDEIEVFYANKWYPAKVVATNARGDVLAEFEYIGRVRQTAFKQDQVRAAYESGALARGRTWTDASGTFKVKAALIELTEEAVTLRKEDKTEIRVPLDKLSSTDRAYLRKLEKELGPIAPKATEAEEFKESRNDSAQWNDVGRKALEPDGIGPDLKLTQAGVVITMNSTFDSLGGLLAVGGPEKLLLVTIENGTPSAPLPTRLIWTSLEKEKVIGEQVLPGGEVVMDYHAASGRMLTYARIKREGNPWGDPVLTLWDVGPADKQPKLVVRWKASDNSAGVQPWARLLDGNTVVQRGTKQEYLVWDAAAKELRYRVRQESFFAPVAALSGGRKYLVVPEDKRVRVLEAATGKLLSTLPAANGSSGVAVSEDGRRLAVLDRSMLTVWDLTSSDSPPETFQAEAIGTPFTADLSWVNADTVAVNTNAHQMILFSLKLKISLWQYTFDLNAVRTESGRRLRNIVDGHLVYSASVDRTSTRSVAVGAVSLPGPKVEEVAAGTTRESLLIVKPGSTVWLEVDAGEHQSRVENALMKKIQENGWVLQPGSPNVLTAVMKQGESQTTTYVNRRTGEEQSVTISPYISSLVLKTGELVAWQGGTSSGAPPFVSLQSGETVQGEADKWNRPRPEFYDQVKIPDSILDPAKRNGLGVTQVTNRGLVPK